jgi:hypothetical protein
MMSALSFLQGQINTLVTQHGALIRAMAEHEREAYDQRFRDLCARHIPRMHEHQHALRELQEQLGLPIEGGGVARTVRRLADTAVTAARDLADVAPTDDYTRLLNDLAHARQCEVTFKVFRDAGRALGIAAFARLGEMAERQHDEFASDASRLLQQMFVEHARNAADAVRVTTATTSQPDAPMG